MKGVLTIVEDHPSGAPSYILSWDTDKLTQSDWRRLNEAWREWWEKGGGMFMLGAIDVVRVKKLTVELNGDEFRLTGPA